MSGNVDLSDITRSRPKNALKAPSAQQNSIIQRERNESRPPRTAFRFQISGIVAINRRKPRGTVPVAARHSGFLAPAFLVVPEMPFAMSENWHCLQT